MPGLTPREKRMLWYLQRYTVECSYSPSKERITKFMDFKYDDSVNEYLQVLTKKGFIAMNKKGVIRITNEGELKVGGY